MSELGGGGGVGGVGGRGRGCVRVRAWLASRALLSVKVLRWRAALSSREQSREQRELRAAQATAQISRNNLFSHGSAHAGKQQKREWRRSGSLREGKKKKKKEKKLTSSSADEGQPTNQPLSQPFYQAQSSSGLFRHHIGISAPRSEICISPPPKCPRRAQRDRLRARLRSSRHGSSFSLRAL